MTPPYSPQRSLFRVFSGFGAVLVAMSLAAAGQAGPLINSVRTDKAQYRTGDSVTVTVSLTNTLPYTWNGEVGVYPRHLGAGLGLDQQQSVRLRKGRSATFNFTFNVNSPDDRGYLAEVWCWRDGVATDRGSTAFDFSSDWTKFPRYGFLTQFSDPTDAAAMIDPMRDHKINAVQFYDWSDEHHINYKPGFDYWQDIAARDPWNSRSKTIELIDRCHDYNMAAMVYQLMYGAYDEYWNDGVQLSWGSFTHWESTQYDPSDQDRYELNISGWETPRIYFFNPASQGWRDWIGSDIAYVFSQFDFDGWHIDTVGDRGELYDWDKNAFTLDATYAGFVNDMRYRFGWDKFLAINTVSNFGESLVAQNAEVDVMYSELWGESDEDDFFDINATLNNIRGNTLKSSVLAGYLHYDYAKGFSSSNPGYVREPAMLLADAAVFASGGWHIELGDGLNVLTNEYFPSHNLIMSTDLKAKVLDYYNFAVAYENVLRDNVWDGNKRVDYDLGGSIPSGYDGTANRVWKLAKWRGGLDGANYYDIAHLINLLNTSDTRWRDPDGTNVTVPSVVTNKPVRVYFNDSWGTSKVWYASPDFENGKAVEVTDYTTNWDASQGQWYVEFTLPEFQYWTMIWLERHF